MIPAVARKATAAVVTSPTGDVAEFKGLKRALFFIAINGAGMRTYLSECIASFFLVFCGTGAVIVNEVSGGAVTNTGIAASFGLIVMAMILAVGDISGAHMNPAVTVAFALQKTFPSRKILPYILSQLCGALTASGILHFIFPTSSTLGATLPSGSATQSFLLEIFLSLVLMLTILHVSAKGREKGPVAALTVGGVVFLEALFAGPICGASMNPARSLAPALVSGTYRAWWIYISAPFFGMMLAAWLYKPIKK